MKEYKSDVCVIEFIGRENDKIKLSCDLIDNLSFNHNNVKFTFHDCSDIKCEHNIEVDGMFSYQYIDETGFYFHDNSYKLAGQKDVNNIYTLPLDIRKVERTTVQILNNNKNITTFLNIDNFMLSIERDNETELKIKIWVE